MVSRMGPPCRPLAPVRTMVPASLALHGRGEGQASLVSGGLKAALLVVTTA